MPARHISSQSFDEILSELGDDPAIPDPHGIRKPPPQANAPARPPSQGKSNLYTDRLNPVELKNLVQNYAGPMALIGLFIAAGIAVFIRMKHLMSAPKAPWRPLKNKFLS